MIYKEIIGNLFEEKNCYFTYCISRDLECGIGIELFFNRNYDVRNKLVKITKYNPFLLKHYTLQIENIFCLVVKEKFYKKPSYKRIRRSLIELKKLFIHKEKYNEIYKRLGINAYLDNKKN
ncbi:hypothetical protein [Fusobacterium varium]|uniref:hypothetical protein n=1 Tax=Fusobacterium varium TaxID=856 RepID=UPI00356A52C4